MISGTYKISPSEELLKTELHTNTRRKNLSRAIAAMRKPTHSFETLKDEYFLASLGNLALDPSVRRMASINHHNDSTLSHSITVAHVSFYLAKLFRLDAISTARGALLHDFFLYDWQHCSHRRHRTKHPGTALGNAVQRFTLNPVEKDIILTHMWPVARPFYTFRESFLVSSVDKLVSVNAIGYILGSTFTRWCRKKAASVRKLLGV